MDETNTLKKISVDVGRKTNLGYNSDTYEEWN